LSQHKPKQSLGQNFLVDENIARKIAKSIDIQRTTSLLKSVLDAARLLSISREAASNWLQWRSTGVLWTASKNNSHSRTSQFYIQDFLECSLAEWSGKFKKKIRLVGIFPII